MDKFLKKQNLSKLAQDETENLSSSSPSKDSKSVIKNISKKKKRTTPDDFTGRFYQAFKKEIKLFQKIKDHLSTIL